jgi:hypothetical protein
LTHPITHAISGWLVKGYADEATYRPLPANSGCPLESADSPDDSALLRFAIWTAPAAGSLPNEAIMPLAKSPILTPARLAPVAQVCAWWYADEATYAIWRALPPNPRCPLESTDSSGDSTLLQIPIWASARRQTRRAKPSKPKRLNAFAINKIARKSEKQTQARYQTCYQSLTAILAPILRKYEWMHRPLLRIRGRGPALAAAQVREGFTTKATMLFRTNRMAFGNAPYCRLGLAPKGAARGDRI